MNYLIKIFFILIALKNVQFVFSTDYEFVPDNEKIFTACASDPKGIHKLFDMTNYTVTETEDGYIQSGFIKNVWDVNPDYKITVI